MNINVTVSPEVRDPRAFIAAVRPAKPPRKRPAQTL